MASDFDTSDEITRDIINCHGALRQADIMNGRLLRLIEGVLIPWFDHQNDHSIPPDLAKSLVKLAEGYDEAAMRRRQR